jgi:hypothetical protein
MLSEQVFEERFNSIENHLHKTSSLNRFTGEYERLLERVKSDQAEAETDQDKKVCTARFVTLRFALFRQICWLSAIREVMVARGHGHGGN